jgi:hypothetical protein
MVTLPNPPQDYSAGDQAQTRAAIATALNTQIAPRANPVFQGTVRMPVYTVANLPAATAGATAFASNGRKNGEGVGLGTGVLVFNDGTAWRACDTGATVAA